MIRMTYDPILQYGDIDRAGDKNLIDGYDLETAVLISILTERRVEPGDEYAETIGYKGGHWSDAVADDRIGSRMWLIRREKLTASNLNLAKTYLEECLQWMIEDGVADSITVTTERGKTPIDLRANIDIQRPGEAGIWSYVWEARLNEL